MNAVPHNTSCPGPGGVRASYAGRSCDFAVGSINAAAYDSEGDVTGVVFPCGWILENASGAIRLYYGGADSCLALALLDDDALWRVARSHMPEDLAEQLESLHLKRQRDGFTDAEAQQVAEFVRQYERTMLLRAQATAVLKERGHDISQLAMP